jgi:hypothetical protein
LPLLLGAWGVKINLILGYSSAAFALGHLPISLPSSGGSARTQPAAFRWSATCCSY